MRGLSQGSSVKDYFGSNLFQRFAAGRVFLVATLLVGLMGTVSAQSWNDSFEDQDFSEYEENNVDDIEIVAESGLDGTYAVEYEQEDDLSGRIYHTLDTDFDTDRVYTARSLVRWDIINNYQSVTMRFGKDSNGDEMTVGYQALNNNWYLPDGTTINHQAPNTGVLYTMKVTFKPGEWGEYRLIKPDGTNYFRRNVSIGSMSEIGIGLGGGQGGGSSARAYQDRLVFTTRNNAPVFDSVSTSPSSWTLGSSVNVSANVSDGDGTVSSVSADVWEDGTQIVSDASLSDSDGDGTWNIDNLFTVDESDVYYNVTLTATDDDGATKTTSIDRYLSNDAPEVNISAPINQELYGAQSRNYDAEIISSTDSKPEENITYTVNLNGQQIDQASNTGDFNISGTLNAQEGSNSLEVVADDGVNQASESLTFEVDTTAPSIDILQPNSFEPDRTNVNLNANVTDPNLNTCYYSLDGEENQTLVDCNTAQLVVGEIGQHEVTVYAEDTLGNTGSESKSFEADYENSIQLEDSVSGSQIQEFQVGFQSNESDIGAGGSTSDGEFNFNTSSLPTRNVTATFTANGYNTRQESFQVDDSFTLSESYQMERAGIFIEAFEEVSQESIEFDLFARNNAGEEYQAYNLSNFEREFDNLPSGFPTGEVEIRIDDAESNYENSAEFNQFRPREYVVTINENTRTNLNAQLLERGSGIFVTIETSDGSGNRVQGALINVQRNIVNGYTTVSTKKTQTDGSASFYLDPDTAYQVLASKQGFSSFQGTFSPVNYQAEPLQIALGTESNYVRSNTWDSIEYSLNPRDNRINLTGMQNFNFSVTDTDSGLEEVGIRVFNESGSKVGEHSVTGSPSGMGANLDLNLSSLDLEGGERLTALGYFVKEGESYTVQRTYTARKHIVPGLSSIVALFDGAENLGDTTKGMIALMASIITGLSLKTRINTKGAGLISLGVLGVFVMSGWFNGFFFLITLFMLVGLYGSR